MEPYVERMIKEYYDLNDKVNKLQVFILGDKFNELEEDEQLDLSAQFHAMEAYRIALQSRLKRRGCDVRDCESEEDVSDETLCQGFNGFFDD